MLLRHAAGTQVLLTPDLFLDDDFLSVRLLLLLALVFLATAHEKSRAHLLVAFLLLAHNQVLLGIEEALA